jgi:hypothetical protein
MNKQIVMVLAFPALSCGEPGEPNQCANASVTEASAAEALKAQAQDGSWRERIDSLVAAAPADSVMASIVVMYRNSPTVEDRGLLDEVGAVITYEYRLIPAFTIDISVAGVAILAQSENIAVIGISGTKQIFYPTGCQSDG